MRYCDLAIDELLKSEPKMTFLSGPRQVGKTTYVLTKIKEPKNHYFNWDIERDRTLILQKKEDFWRERDDRAKVIALDEIHKFPRWKRLLKGLYDSTLGVPRILVTGSGKLDIYQRGGDSLFGRYNHFHLFPLTLGELISKSKKDVSAAIDLHQQIKNGSTRRSDNTLLTDLLRYSGFPEPFFAQSEQRHRRWQNQRNHVVLKEDVRDLSRVFELGLIENLMFLLPSKIGSPLSINSLREDLQIAFQTAKNWLQILERLYYIFSIPSFQKGINKTIAKEKKIYFCDWSILKDKGPCHENFVALHLYKAVTFWNDCGLGNYNLFYLRTREAKEVDFLITLENRPLHLIEVKSAKGEISKDLLYFHDRIQPEASFQVHFAEPQDEYRELRKNIFSISAARLLATLP